MGRRISQPKRGAARVVAPRTQRPGVPGWLMGVLLVLVTLALFWPATGHNFVHYDDYLYVLDNPHVTSGLSWANARWALGSGYAFNWHPVTWLSHMLDCQLFGLRPWGHHLTSVGLHALNALLVFLLLRQLTGARWRALLVAALFGLHPLRVESVAWVAERKDVLSGLFGLLTLLAYVKYAGSLKSKVQSLKSKAAKPGDASPSTLNPQPSTIEHFAIGDWQWAMWYCLALLFFALGLMSKPMLVTWPFVLLLLDFWPLGRLQTAPQPPPVQSSKFIPLLVEKLPFLALAITTSIVTFLVQKHAGSVVSVGNLPLGARLGNALISYCRYVGKMFWPTDLAVFYPHPGEWPLVLVLLAGALLLGLSALLLLKRRQYPFLPVGWLWFVGTLVPVIGLVQVGDQAMADRYTYLPSLGLLILTVWGGYAVTQRWPKARRACTVAACAALLLCLALTRLQLGYWTNSEVLFRHAIGVTGNNSLAHDNLGVALVDENRMTEAIEQFQEAIRLKPDYPMALFQLGSALEKEGRLDEALTQFQQALYWNPNYADVHNLLGYVLFRKGLIDAAIEQYHQALRLQPDYPDAHCNLGVALVRQGHFEEGMREYRETLRLKPEDAEAYYNLANALAAQNQIDAAIAQYQEALRRKPDYPEAHNNLGIALVRKGEMDAATSEFQEAVRLKPDYAQARENLARALELKQAPVSQ